MAICQLHNIILSFGYGPIFENCSLSIDAGTKMGIVGANGCGKSTLLKLITGEVVADKGDVFIAKGTRVGYLQQSYRYGNETVQSRLWDGVADVLEVQRALRQCEQQMSDPSFGEGALERIFSRYEKLQASFEQLDGYAVEARMAKVAEGLDIVSLLNEPMHTLSGGEQTRTELARLLLQSPDLLLLDEPTNHLDVQAVEWLGAYLRSYRGTVLIVSHNRAFLDDSITQVLDIDAGECVLYKGNYSAYVEEKETRLLAQYAAYTEQQKQMKKMREAIKRLRTWADTANPPNEGLHRRARNMERALERMTVVKRPQLERKKMQLSPQSTERSGRDVFILRDVSFGYGENLLYSGVSVHIRKGERLAIVGENGSGKSTLLQLLQGELDPCSGFCTRGANVKIGVVKQHETWADDTITILDAFRAEVPYEEGMARQRLAGYLFYGAAVFKTIRMCSGGERMRLRLAILMEQGINVLLLDEPTNHLDIDSVEVLEDTIRAFEGTVIAVSHDRYFVDRLFEELFIVSEQTVVRAFGTFSNWRASESVK
ncbi:MAG: ribosomal protection-like ABC-F family protein [Bacilli bacterium]